MREPAGCMIYRARLGAVRSPNCADQEQTTIAEMRPATGEYVSVAEIYTQRELRLLDLATEPTWPNPFTDTTAHYEVELSALLVAFAEQLEKPLWYRDDPTDDLPSQRLAELIETTGVDGIRYPSSMMPEGTNIVLFDPSVIGVGE